MVEIEHMPVKKLVVHEVYKYDKREELMLRAVRPNGVLPLYWSNGVLFFFFPFSSSDAKKDYLKGIFHIEIVSYCLMPEYKSMLEMEDEQIKGVKIRVMDLSKFELFKDLAKWLKAKK
jgi:hypothetical protein